MASATVAGLRDAAAAGSAPFVAQQLLALFEQAAQEPDRVQWVDRQIAANLRGTADPVLARACTAVAVAIDAQPATFDRLGYHNRQHFCEVALTAYSLCLLERLAAPQIDRLMVLVLATDPSEGTAFMSATGRGRIPPAVPADAPELAALVSDPELARLARLLCEADVLPSIGLDAAHALRVQERLAREWQRPLDPADKLVFMDFVLRQGYIGDFFLPCVHATRAALASGLDAAVQG